MRQKEAFVLMISCAASSCPFRFPANPRLYVKVLYVWICLLKPNPRPPDMFRLPSVHILVRAKVAVFSLERLCTCVNARCDFHSVSNSVNIPSLVCSEHLQLLSLSSFSPSPPFLPQPLSNFLLAFSPGLHAARGED